MSAAGPRVVCFGEALIDFFPAGGARGSIERVPRFERHLGGAPANAAVGLARLGVPVALLGAAGDDGFGRFLRARLAEEGVGTGAMALLPARTGLAFVSWEAPGERRFLFYRRGTADAMIDAGLVQRHAGLVRQAQVVHLSTSALAQARPAAAAQAVVEIALTAGAAVSVDANLRLHLWPGPEEAAAVVRGVVRRARLVKASRDEAAVLVGEETPAAAARAIAALGPEVVAVTDGERGAWYAVAGREGWQPAPTVEDPADTTGAGDAFLAALLAGLLARGWPARPAAALPAEALDRAVAAACAAGARACTAVGATTAMPAGDPLALA